MSKSARQSASEVLRVQKVVKTPSPSISCVASDSSVPDDMEPADGASIEGVVVATEEIFQDSQSSDGEGQTAGASDNIQQDDSADLSSKNGQSCSFGATSSSSSNSNGISESAGSNVKSEDFRCSNANQASSSGSSKGVIANGNGTSSSSGARSKVGLHSGSSSSSSGSKARKQNDHAELLVALTEQIQLFEKEVEAIQASGHLANLHADLPSRTEAMNKKFANAGADQFLSGATVVLLQCIIGAFTHGPLTERDLRIRVDTQCQALGISTSSKGTPAGTLVEINSACNVLMQLGILELVAPSEATAVLAETDSDAQSDTKSSSVAAVAADALVSKLQDSWNEYIDRYRAAASAAGAPPTEGMRRFNFDFSMDVAADDDDLPKLERSGASDTGSTTLANSANETTMDDADDGGNETQLIKLERCSSKATDDGDDCTAEVSLVRSRGRPPSSSSRKKAKQKTKRNVGALRIWKLRDDLCTLSKDAVAPCESTMQQDNSFSSNPAAWLQVLSEKHYQMNAALELEERIMRRLAGQCEFPMAYANHRTGTSYLVSGAACRTASAGSAYADDTATANGAAYPGVGGNANCMDVYNTEKRITADYLLDKVKASRRQRGACLVKQHNQLITSYLNDLAAKEDTYLAKSYDLNQPRMVGIYDESYIDAARGVCKRNASSVWREGNDASRKGKDRVTMADFSRELIRECRQSSSGSNAAIQGALLTAAQLHDLDLMNGRNRTFDASQEVNILSIRRYGVPLELEDAHTAAPTQSFRVITDGDADSIEGANRNAVYALPDMKIVTSEIPWQEVAGEFYYLIPSTEADAAPAAEVKSSSSSSTTTTTGPLSSDALKRPESRNSLTSRASGSARRRSSSQLSECPAAPPLAMKRSTSQASTCSEERIGNAVDQPMKKVRLYVSRPVNDVRASAIVDEKRLSPRESSAVSHQESSGSSSSSSNPIDVVAPNFQLITSATEKIKLQQRDGAMEDDSSVEDTSDERFAAAHEAVLTKMRDQWAVIKSLQNELGIGTSVPGSHLRRRASFDFTRSLLPQSAADADGSTGLTPGGSLRGSNGSIRALSIDASDAGPATFGSSGPVSALTPANGNLFSSQKKLRRRGPGRPRKRF